MLEEPLCNNKQSLPIEHGAAQQWWQRKYIKHLNGPNGILVIKYHDLYIFHIMVRILWASLFPLLFLLEFYSRVNLQQSHLWPNPGRVHTFIINHVYQRFTTWLQNPAGTETGNLAWIVWHKHCPEAAFLSESEKNRLGHFPVICVIHA